MGLFFSVMLLSKLESFSNNIIEAWHFKRNLVIADEPWARSICENAALYVDRDDPYNIVESIATLEANQERKNFLISAGVDKLEEFPSIEQKIQEEINFLRDTCERY